MADLLRHYNGDGEIGDMGELLELIAFGHPAWHADAACREHPELDWFAEDPDGIEAAIDVCRTDCLARFECYSSAMAGPVSLVGVWAGTTPADRAQLRLLTSPGENMRQRPRQLYVRPPTVPRETGDDGRIVPRQPTMRPRKGVTRVIY
jgi:hypothetical protein